MRAGTLDQAAVGFVGAGKPAAIAPERQNSAAVLLESLTADNPLIERTTAWCG
jgi:hypothetical protein